MHKGSFEYFTVGAFRDIFVILVFLSISQSTASARCFPSAVRGEEVSDGNGSLSCVFQAMRTLSWKPHLGSVTLDVELEDRTLTNITVSPIQAAIILHFQEKSKSFHF